MSRLRLFGCAVLAVLAVLVGGTAPAAAVTLLHGAGRPAPVLHPSDSAHPASAPSGRPAPRTALTAPGLPDRPRADPAPEGDGPACAPAAPDRGGMPAAPSRAGGEHAQVPPGRTAPAAARPYADPPVRAPVRGPVRPAPGPSELSVMRV
ncbi:hypothetical protein ACIPRL_23565 [Streptomyces sp. NPDC090085]|uniref:hypothetical protein n=1 Tax=Streptomyces sp. NPDC090085 TaxID=3365943 RepID=UPI0037F2A882